MSRKKRMIYVPLDVEFFDNDKILAVGERPAYLYLAMLCRVKRLGVDGILSRLQIERLQIAGWQKRLTTLVSAGLVMQLDDGRYLVAGWLERNPSADEIAEYRRKDSDRKKRQSDTESDGIPGGIRADSATEEEEENQTKEKGIEVKPRNSRSDRSAA
jgi:hypothetical protein